MKMKRNVVAFRQTVTLTLPVAAILSRLAVFVRRGQDHLFLELVQRIIEGLTPLALKGEVDTHTLYFVFQSAVNHFTPAEKYVVRGFVPILLHQIEKIDPPISKQFVEDFRKI